MNQDIPEAGYRTPWHVRLARLDLIGQTLTRLRQRLQIANDRILNQPGGAKMCLVTTDVLVDAVWLVVDQELPRLRAALGRMEKRSPVV